MDNSHIFQSPIWSANNAQMRLSLYTDHPQAQSSRAACLADQKYLQKLADFWIRAITAAIKETAAFLSHGSISQVQDRWVSNGMFVCRQKKGIGSSPSHSFAPNLTIGCFVANKSVESPDEWILPGSNRLSPIPLTHKLP